MSLAFFRISALVSPIGLFVTFDKLGLDTASTSVELLVFVILFAIYLGSFYVYRKTIFTLFSIIFGTITFFLLVQWLIGSSFTYANSTKIFEYRFLVTGIVYCLLGYYFTSTSQKALTGVLY